MGHDYAAMGGMNPRQHYQMMVDMAMSTAQLPWALAVGAASVVVLIALLVRTTWPLSAATPTAEASLTVGELLLSRYMIGFEGAAFLILGGIAGAVILAKQEGAPPVPRGTTRAEPEQRGERGRTYTCPMHPEVRELGSGTCPKCGMALVLEKEQQGAPEQAVYTCPMHPEVRQQGPGTCPKCGMDLVPAGLGHAEHGEHGGE